MFKRGLTLSKMAITSFDEYCHQHTSQNLGSINQIRVIPSVNITSTHLYLELLTATAIVQALLSPRVHTIDKRECWPTSSSLALSCWQREPVDVAYSSA